MEWKWKWNGMEWNGMNGMEWKLHFSVFKETILFGIFWAKYFKVYFSILSTFNSPENSVLITEMIPFSAFTIQYFYIKTEKDI